MVARVGCLKAFSSLWRKGFFLITCRLIVCFQTRRQIHAVSVRLRTNENLERMPLADFVERIAGIIRSRSSDL